MLFLNRLTAIVLSAALLAPVAPLEAASHKGNKLFAQGRAAEEKKDWDGALEAYAKALAGAPSDIQFQMAVDKARFQSSQAHVEKGVKVRNQGLLGEALIEFQRAFSTNPGSVVAIQEIQTTQEMIKRERQRILQTGKESTPEERALTPLQKLKLDTEDRLDRILPIPELKPISSDRVNLKMNSATPKVMYETVAGMAGINVIIDPDSASGISTSPRSLNLQNSTLDEALDSIAVLTKTFWKPVSTNTIFVAADNQQKRRDLADQVLRVFYLSNIQATTELQEIVNAVRTVTDVQRMFQYNGQNAIVVRGEADQVALVEKIIHDLDRPRAEVVVDIVVMETTSVYSRQLTAALASTGLNIPVNFTPRNGLMEVKDSSSANNTGTNTNTSTSVKGSNVPLSNLGHLASSDWSTTLPTALLEAVMSDANTKVLQSPQLRSLDNTKASLRIGEKQPTASGSFGGGVAQVGYSSLVNTQFQYLEVGVNMDMLPRVHDNGEVTIHVELEISNVTGTVNLGGIDQPIIGQRKFNQDIRMREGEIGLIGGLVKQQDSKSVTGIPGLSKIPLLRRLFTGESIDKQRNELLIALVPHIIRRPVFTAENLRTIAVGTASSIKLNYAPPAEPAPAEKPEVKPETPAPAAPAPAPTATTPAPSPAPAPMAAAPATAPPAPGALPATAPPMANLLNLPQPQAPAAVPPGQQPQPAASPAIARFQPARVDMAANGNVTVGLVLDGGANVASATPIQISYDPKMLSVADISVGDLLAKDGVQPMFSRNIMNDMGLATIQLSRPPGAPGVAGPGTLVAVKFQAIGHGATSVAALNVTVRNAQGLVIGTASPTLPVNIK
jgi:general secretion pathway protein D